MLRIKLSFLRSSSSSAEEELSSYREEEVLSSNESGGGRRGRSRGGNRLFNSSEAPRSQQIGWSKQMTSQDATIDSVLSLFAAHGKKLSARNVATTAHRVAKIGRRQNRRLKQDCRMKALAAACLNSLNDFETQHLANVAWAYATIDIEAPALFNAIVADVALTKLDSFTPQVLPTLRGHLLASVEVPALFNAIAAAAALTKLDDFKPQELANTLWAFATASVEAPALFHAIAAAAALTKLDGFTPQALANTAWAFATTSVEAPTLFKAIADDARTKLHDFNPQDIANTAWAFACIGRSSLDFFVALLSSVSVEHQISFTVEELSQLHMVFLYFQLEYPDQEFPLAHMHSQLLTAFKSQEPRPSKLQCDVASALTRIRWDHAFEYVTPENLSLDT